MNSRRNGSRVSEIGKQSFMRDGQFLRQDAGFTHNRNKIRITDPTGHYVEVEMMLDARSGGSTEIETEIVPIGMIFAPQRILALAAQINDFVQFLSGCFAER